MVHINLIAMVRAKARKVLKVLPDRERYVKCRGYGLGGTGIPRAAHRAI